jgi:hypothetical protein
LIASARRHVRVERPDLRNVRLGLTGVPGNHRYPGVCRND